MLSVWNYKCLCFPGKRQWQYNGVQKSTPVLLPGKSQGQRSLVGCSPWGREERLHFHFSLFTFMHWRRKWQPTTVFLPGESQRQGSLVGCRLLGHTESDMTGATQQQQQHAFQGCQTINKCHLGIVNHGIFSENTHTHTHTHNVLSLNQFVEETKSWLHLVLPIYK